jgi:hypothetical protein
VAATVNTQTPPATDQPDQRPAEPADQAHGLAAALAAYREVRKTTYRYRDAIVPHTAVFGTLTAGYALHACQIPAWQVLAAEAAAAGTAALWPVARAAMTSRIRILAAASGWLAVAAEIGAGGWMQTALVVAGGIAAIPRIWRYRIRITRPAPKPRRALPPGASQAAVEGPDPNVQIWAAKTARSRGRSGLPGSKLTDRQPFEYGVRYRIVLDGQTTEDAIGARKQICSDFGKRYEELHIEATEDQQLNAAELTILSRLAVEDVQQWTAPLLDAETGVLALGPFADGRGDGAVQVWEPGSGPLPVAVFGAMRVGKSSLVKLAAVEFKRHGKIKMIYMDPQRGQSAPALLPYLPNPALGIDAIRATLYRLRDEMYARNAMLKDFEWTDSRGQTRRGKQSYDAPGMNGLDMLVGVIDESHRVLMYDDLAEIVFEILAEGSKCGITLWTLNQSALVNDIGGGSILNLLNSGNIVVLRTGDTYTAQATFGQRLDAHPHLIPKVFPNGVHSKGCGYVLGATTRPVMMRVRDIPDEGIDEAMGGEPMSAIRWLAPPRALPDGPEHPGTAAPMPSATGTTQDAPPAPDVAAATRADTPDETSAPEPAEDVELNLDNVVDFTPIDPAQAADAEQRILRLLDGAEHGLDGADLAMGAELHPVVAFRVVADLVARGQVAQADDRYVRVAS